MRMGKNKENIEKSMIGREPISDELEKCSLKQFQVVLFMDTAPFWLSIL